MSLKNRLKSLEGQFPQVQPRGERVPADSFLVFVRFLMSRESWDGLEFNTPDGKAAEHLADLVAYAGVLAGCERPEGMPSFGAEPTRDNFEKAELSDMSQEELLRFREWVRPLWNRD